MDLYLGYPLSRAMVLGTILSMLMGCGSKLSSYAPPTTPPSVTKSPKVVVTNSVLCDLTQQLAAETIALTCLSKPGIDPHTYEPTPSDRKAIEEADLILYNGYDLEPRLEKLVMATSGEVEKVAVAEIAVPKPLQGASHNHGDSSEHQERQSNHALEHPSESHGNPFDTGSELEHQTEDAAPDPHVWQSAEYGQQMVAVMQASLAKLVPQERDRYAANAQTLQAELTQLHTWIKAQIQTIPAQQRRLITTHDALEYYANAYGITVEGTLQGISTEAKPSAGRMKVLIQEIRASGVSTIFGEQTDNSRFLATIAKEAGVRLAAESLYVDGLGDPSSDGATYQAILIANTKTIVQGLGGRYMAFKTTRSAAEQPF